MSRKTLRIGTRASQLALWQANWVKSCLEQRYPDLEVTLTKIKTQGDRILDVPLAMVGGKGLFVKEIEEAMLRDEVDIAVHSMKDVPTVFPEGLALRCITEREDPRDILVLRPGVATWRELPQGARIGTSSLRRKSQMLHERPDLHMLDIRGNVETRLRKLTEEDLDGVVLASAGMKRLGFAARISEYLAPEVMLPAIGQGALGLESRVDDAEINALIDFFNHSETAYAVTAERALLRHLEGGCQVPIAAYGTVSGDQVRLTGLVASVDGRQFLKKTLSGPVAEAQALGVSLAEDLLVMGADKILNEVYQHETFNRDREDV
ncbi:hydroxymethylbilane synthase [Geoalkalibacter ferrihydriticus]|uniref:Porphobilinogen deaminase n=2 Tax=Geoalkalibacter ferrihydriticus TaxID=392333 RepID=A0A0C2DQH6_9BACT|nr:hydroxymethylbilane synthase [Geoalkalibacter ferrihydriticus]KIH75654.1 hydroxymethylbilane synthase [Geoalkalibacter ferrihydriticus DSM 17813]SDM71705.1 hydroxymethylbilane synthase [Geoalkalibacter ferrihydriticus]